MKDPIMCRPEDRDNECNVTARLANHLKLKKGSETDTLCSYDASLWKDAVLKFLVEVKTRNYVWGEHPLNETYNIGENKLRRLLEFIAQLRRTGFPDCHLLLAVKDRHGDIYYRQIDSLDDFSKRQGGRRDRVGVSTDQEMMVHIPVKSFIKI